MSSSISWRVVVHAYVVARGLEYSAAHSYGIPRSSRARSATSRSIEWGTFRVAVRAPGASRADWLVCQIGLKGVRGVTQCRATNSIFLFDGETRAFVRSFHYGQRAVGETDPCL
jgi:hypothetical protein